MTKIFETFECDRCKKHSPSADKRTVNGGLIVKEAFRISDPPPLEFDGKFAIRVDPVYKVDLCIPCAVSLVELLREWWSPAETMVEFVDIEDIFDSIYELDDESSN